MRCTTYTLISVVFPQSSCTFTDLVSDSLSLWKFRQMSRQLARPLADVGPHVLVSGNCKGIKAYLEADISLQKLHRKKCPAFSSPSFPRVK